MGPFLFGARTTEDSSQKSLLSLIKHGAKTPQGRTLSCLLKWLQKRKNATSKYYVITQHKERYLYSGGTLNKNRSLLQTNVHTSIWSVQKVLFWGEKIQRGIASVPLQKRKKNRNYWYECLKKAVHLNNKPEVFAPLATMQQLPHRTVSPSECVRKQIHLLAVGLGNY